MKKQEYKIKIKQENGEYIEKTVNYNVDNLTVEDEERLRDKGSSLRYMEIDYTQVEVNSLKNKSGHPTDKAQDAIKKMDVQGMQKAKREVNNELAKILFGITEPLGLITASSFKPLRKFVEKEDVLGFKRELEDVNEGKEKGGK